MILSRFGLQAAALAVGAGALVTSCVVRDRSVEQRGAAKAVATINQQTQATNEKARQARAAARAPGAPDRVLSEYCRDC